MLTRRARTTDGRASAQALVEFALTVPMFLALLLTMVDFGMGVYAYNNVAHAAQEGMRRGIVLGKDCGAYTKAGNKQNVATGTTASYGVGIDITDTTNYPHTFTTSTITSPIRCVGNASARSTIVGAVSNSAGILDRSRVRVVISQAPGGTAGTHLAATTEPVRVYVFYRYQPIWGYVVEGLANYAQLNLTQDLSANSLGRVQ